MPKVLFNQFRQFYNLFFLLICLAQIFPPIRIGLLITYIGPLAFVLFITLCKEGYDDFLRFRRDKELNSEKFQKLMQDGTTTEISGSDIKAGDIMLLERSEEFQLI